MANESDIKHLLRRTEFVARPQRVAELVGGSLEQAVDNILDVARNGDVTPPSAFVDPKPADGWAQYSSAYSWWVDRMVDRPRPFQEKMTLFWHGHFTSSWNDGVPFHLMMRQNHLYRTRALGNVVDLTQRMAVEPAMLLYLSNASNVKAAPNENFARELMELYTLGIGNYTQSDVVAAARAWTGHGYDVSIDGYRFRPDLHDDGQKTLFGRTRNWNGPDIVAELFNRPDTSLIAARFIARKLWEFLAAPGPEATLVAQLGDVLLSRGFEIRALVRAILLRPEFYRPETRHGLVRPPIDWTVAVLHHSALRADDLWLASRMGGMGQTLFSPPNVDGWKGNAAWVSTGGLGARAEIAKTVAWWNLRSGGRFDDLWSLSVEAAVDRVASFFDVDLAATTRAAIVAAHRAERSSGDDPAWAPTNLLLITMLSPEFNLA